MDRAVRFPTRLQTPMAYTRAQGPGHQWATGYRGRQEADDEGSGTFLLRTLGFILHEMGEEEREQRPTLRFLAQVTD